MNKCIGKGKFTMNNKEVPKNFDLNIWKKLLVFAKPHKKLFITGISFTILCSILEATYPIMQKFAIDNFIVKNTTQNIAIFITIYLVILLLQCYTVLIFTRKSMEIDCEVGKDLKKASFYHLQNLSLSYYNTNSVGYMMARVMSDTNKITGMIAWGLSDVFWALFYVIFSFIGMLILNVKLTLLVMLIVPFIAVVTVYFQRKILVANRKVRHLNSQLTGEFNEGISGAKTSKTLSIEHLNDEEFRKSTLNMKKHSYHAQVLNAIYIPLVTFFSSIAIDLVLVQGGKLVMEDLILVGTLSAFFSYALGIFEPIQQIARVISEIISAQANIERLFALIEEKPIIVDSDEVIKKYGDCFNPKEDVFEKIKGEIEFKNIDFKYPDGEEYILENFNLKIKAGTTVAIVGKTGAGKSTLVNLACRFFEPTKGEILIDGIDYKKRSQLWLHKNIGYVLQSPHLFSGTIKDNIRYGKLDATDEEIVSAAKAVFANLVIDKLDKGFESDVGENGDKLSTGEKQLISFARAVIRNPAIFVLDEATSSIDTITEKLIQDAISHMLKGRTSFLIAHRLSTIRHADIILVVESGKIIEQGTHEELMKKKSEYYNLYTKQFMIEKEERRVRGEKN